MSPLALTPPPPRASISAFSQARRGAVGAGAAGLSIAAYQDFNSYFFLLSQRPVPSSHSFPRLTGHRADPQPLLQAEH